MGHLVRGADEREEHLRGDLHVSAGSVAVGWLPDGEMRQQGIEFVVRQARDDLPGERVVSMKFRGSGEAIVEDGERVDEIGGAETALDGLQG